MRYALLAAAMIAAGPAASGGLCDPRYTIECVPVAAAPVVRHATGYVYAAIPKESHRPVVTGDPFIGGSGYVKDVPAYPLAVQAPHALRPVPYVWGHVTNPAGLPQDPAPHYVKVRVKKTHYVRRAHPHPAPDYWVK